MLARMNNRCPGFVIVAIARPTCIVEPPPAIAHLAEGAHDKALFKIAIDKKLGSLPNFDCDLVRGSSSAYVVGHRLERMRSWSLWFPGKAFSQTQCPNIMLYTADQFTTVKELDFCDACTVAAFHVQGVALACGRVVGRLKTD